MNNQAVAYHRDEPSPVPIWPSLRQEFLYLSWAVMEVALITPLFLALAPWARFWSPALAGLWLLLLMLVPFNMARLGSALGVTTDSQRVHSVIGLLVFVIIAWRYLLIDDNSLFDPDWIIGLLSSIGTNSPQWSRLAAIFAIVLVAWWRGLSLLRRRTDIGDMGLRLRIGALLIAPVLIVFTTSRLVWSVAPFILLFLFASLIALVLTRVEQLQDSWIEYASPLRPRWLSIIGIVSATIMTTAFVTATIISGASLPRLIAWLEPLWLAVSYTAASAGAAFFYLSLPALRVFGRAFEWLYALIQPGFQGVLERLQIAELAPYPMVPAEKVEPRTDLFGLDAGRLLLILGMVLLILLVSLALRRIVGRKPAAGKAVEAVNPFEDIRGPASSRLGRRLRRRLAALRHWRAAASIRRIYVDMCGLAAEYGYPRQESETPHEYLSTLNLAWPNHGSETQLITEAYNRVRYGEIAETVQELEQITAAWKTLRTTELME